MLHCYTSCTYFQSLFLPLASMTLLQYEPVEMPRAADNVMVSPKNVKIIHNMRNFILASNWRPYGLLGKWLLVWRKVHNCGEQRGEYQSTRLQGRFQTTICATDSYQFFLNTLTLYHLVLGEKKPKLTKNQKQGGRKLYEPIEVFYQLNNLKLSTEKLDKES